MVQNLDYKQIITVALIGAVAVYVVKTTAAAAIETVADELSFDNTDGVGNQVAGSVYDATHDENGAIKFWAAPFWFLDKASDLPTNGISFSW